MRKNHAQAERKIRARIPFLAVEAGKIPAFAEVVDDGYIDYFCGDREHLRRGVGCGFYDAIKNEAGRPCVPRFHAAVSLNARAFFLRMEFEAAGEQRNAACGAIAPNFFREWNLPD